MMVTVLLFPLAVLLGRGQPVHAQAEKPENSVTLQGMVRDLQSHPVSGAEVYLQVDGAAKTLTTRTDAAGNYRFLGLREGACTLRAQMSEYREAATRRCVLSQKEPNRIDLTLDSSKAKAAQDSSIKASGTGKPEFFDEPAFTVAGVTDTTNLGGHGSDTILRSKESLARETVALNKEATAPAPPLTATEKDLRQAVKREPDSFDANHKLGKSLIDNGRSREAIPYLERAFQINSDDYSNSYDLARAYADMGDYERARTTAKNLLPSPGKSAQDKSGQDKAEIHVLLGDVEEKSGNPLQAVREYQRAAEIDPSETNLFDWGAELLLHHAPEPAAEVFTNGSRRYPRSVRMLIALSVADYAHGSYEQAAQRLCEASDLNPEDSQPYLFMGKMQSAGAAQAECFAEELARFAKLQPESALANYYYAVSLLKQRKSPEDTESARQVESLLGKAVRLDPRLGDGYLQLGILYADQQDFSRAIVSYQNAVKVSPELEQAHYRLAQAYRRTGEKLKAQQELELYQQLSKKKEEEQERQRREIQQFVYTLRDGTDASQSQD
jgi:tetratricopeptide (TPR) repeat protein